MHIQKIKGGQNGYLPTSVGRYRLPPQQDLSVALGARAKWRQKRSCTQMADCLVGGVPFRSTTVGHHLRHVAELDCGFGGSERCSGNVAWARYRSSRHD